MDKNKTLQIKDIERNLDKNIIFKDDGDFLFIYKKGEKIATAIYLITNFFSPEEPLKSALRETSLSLIKDILNLSNIVSTDVEKIIKDISGTIFRTISLLEISYRSGFVSEMNFSILKDELYGIISILQSRSHESHKVEGITFDKTFFEVNKGDSSSTDQKENRHSRLEKPEGKHFLYKGHSKGHDVLNNIEALHNAYSSAQKPQNIGQLSSENKSSLPLTDKSDERQKMIVNYLKANNVITIKDLTRVIQGCSEKTIQRDLGSLINQGTVKKVGERRWSKYYLV